MKFIKRFYNYICSKKDFSEGLSIKSNHKYIVSLGSSRVIFFLVALSLSFLFYFFNLDMHDTITKYVSFLLMYIYIMSLIFFELYGFLNLRKTWKGFRAIFINLSIFYFYVYSIYILIFVGFKDPIYVDTIPRFAQYRYLILVLFCIIIALVFLMSFYYQTVKQILIKMKLSFFKEEIRVLLDAWKYDLIGYYLNRILDQLSNSKLFRILFFGCSFILFHGYRFFIMLLFINFSIFHGDFRLILYGLPFAFVSWLLSFFFYHLSWFVEANLNALKDYLDIIPGKTIAVNKDLVSLIPQECHFKLTEKAYEKGYTEQDYPSLVTTWFDLSSISTLYYYYNRIVFWFSWIIFSIYFCCWTFLCIKFFGSIESSFVQATGPFWVGSYYKVIVRGFHATSVAYEWDARRIPESSMNKARIETDSYYSPGHFLYGEVKSDGSFVAYGTLTSKDQTSNLEIPVKKLITGTKIDGSSGDQYHIPFKKAIILPKGSYAQNPEGNSAYLLEKPAIKAILEEIKKINKPKWD